MSDPPPSPAATSASILRNDQMLKMPYFPARVPVEAVGDLLGAPGTSPGARAGPAPRARPAASPGQPERETEPPKPEPMMTASRGLGAPHTGGHPSRADCSRADANSGIHRVGEQDHRHDVGARCPGGRRPRRSSSSPPSRPRRTSPSGPVRRVPGDLPEHQPPQERHAAPDPHEERVVRRRRR